MTKEQKLVMEANGKADESAKEGPDVDRGQMAAPKASTNQQLKKSIYASIEHAAHYHPEVDVVPKDKVS